jgi:hypothetical protein
VVGVGLDPQCPELALDDEGDLVLAWELFDRRAGRVELGERGVVEPLLLRWVELLQSSPVPLPSCSLRAWKAVSNAPS